MADLLTIYSNPGNGKCTDKLGVMQLQTTLQENDDELALNSVQNATAMRLSNALQVSSIYYATFSRLANSLRATESLHGRRQLYLPPNQWHIEVSGWFDTGLARLQKAVQEYATGPLIVPRGSYIVRPDPAKIPADAIWEAMCYSQFINDTTDTMSFSVLGLVLLFGIGFLIIIISMTMEMVVGWIQTRFKTGLHAWAEWRVNDKLQMQRLLFEATGHGRWDDGFVQSVPVTGKDQAFPGPAERHLKRHNTKEMGIQGGDVQLVTEHFDTKDDRPYR